jgi:hypothetical protein
MSPYPADAFSIPLIPAGLMPPIPAGAAVAPSPAATASTLIPADPMPPDSATALIPSISAGPMPPNPAAAAVAPMEASEEEDLDLKEVDDQIEQEDEEDAGFDVTENIIANVHQ